MNHTSKTDCSLWTRLAASGSSSQFAGTWECPHSYCL